MTESPEENGESPPLQLTLKKKLIFAGIATLLGLLIIEGTGRLCGFPSGAVRTLSKIGEMDRQTFEGSVGMWRPGFKGHVSWPVEIAYDVAINKHGFRGPDFDLEKKKAFRVLCLGDSTTFSVYVKEGLTYPEILQRELRKDHPEIEVINGGHPAWGTSDQLRFLKERAIKVKPDLIVHLFCGNDPFDIVDAEGMQGNYARKLRRIDEGPSLADQLRFNTAIGEMETRIHIMFKQWRGKKRHIEFNEKAIPDDRWALYKESYGKLVGFCRERKIPIVTACFPRLKEKEALEDRLETKVGLIAMAQKVPLIPLAKAFRDAEKKGEKLYWVPIDSHANERGCELIGVEIAKSLKRLKMGPYGSR